RAPAAPGFREARAGHPDRARCRDARPPAPGRQPGTARMSIELLTLLFFGSLLFFLVLGLPLTFVLGGVSVIFLYFTWGIESFYMVASQVWGSMNSFTL